MTPEDTLASFFAGTMPPHRDLAFQTVVAQRIARRRAFATVGALIPWTIAAMAMCWALGPLLAPFVLALGQTVAPAAAILTMTAVGVATLLAAGRRLHPA